ncbi:MAG: hydrolase [Candidatus Limnocylindria bacterium]
MGLVAFICVTCGVQQAPSAAPPERCPICEDERQYVRQGGQKWTSLDELAASGHRVELRELEAGLYGVGVVPAVAIGQRALLVRTPAGNFLWDCTGHVDAGGVEAVRALGGIAGIAMSHPHFYGVMVEWSAAFGGCPVYIPTADRGWVQRDDTRVVEWTGTREVLPGVTLIQTGGHFEGSAVLHWAAGAEGKGALLVGDSIAVVPDVRAVSFMRSYPNYIPLPPPEIQRIVASVRPYAFDRIYGGWWDRVAPSDGKAAVERSARRYLKWTGSEVER